MKKLMAIAGALACATSFADVEAKDDFLRFDASLSLSQTLTEGESLYYTYEEEDPETGEKREVEVDNRIVFALDSGSDPTVSFTGLPAGLVSEMGVNEEEEPVCIISGTPTKLGVYTVKATATNANGFKYSDYAVMTVSGRPTASGNITPNDFYCSYGEDVGDEPIDALFGISADIKSISVKGLPSGLSLAKESEDGDRSYFIKGAPKKAGTFVATATVTFEDGSKETANSLVIVDPFSPDDLGVDLGGLENLSVGESLGEDGVTLGEYYEKTGPTAISGLPTGLTLKKTTIDGATVYTAYGTPSKEGPFTITGKGDYYNDDDKHKTESFSRTVYVKSGEYRYVDVSVSENGTGKGEVSGEGAYAPLAKVTVTATPAEGSVFSGWLDQNGDAVDIEGFDYRTPSFTFQLAADSPATWQATFADSEEDALSIDMEDEFTTGDAGEVNVEIGVTSVSLPNVTVTGLPKGLTFNAAALTVTGTLSTPGEYTFEISATNVTNKDPVKKTVAIKFPNMTSEKITGISPEMDAYVYVAGVAIDPIVPEVEKGYTLTVAGLPTGLKYNKTTGIAGTPTKAGGYTVTLTAKMAGAATEVATIFILVKNVTVTLETGSYDDPSATGTVTGAGSYPANKKVTIKATAAKNSVFTGWYQGGELVSGNVSYTFTTGTEDVTYRAVFCTKTEDAPYAFWFNGESYAPDADPIELSVYSGVPVTFPVEAWSIGANTLKATGLPAGLKLVQDKETKEYSISGTPTTPSKVNAKSGLTTPSAVKITATTTAGKTSSVFNINITVNALPTSVGTFNGFAYTEGKVLLGCGDGPDCDYVDPENVKGLFTASVTAAGKITAKVTLQDATYSFSAASWDELDGKGMLFAELETKAGDVLELVLDTTAPATAFQMQGTLIKKDGETVLLTAQRDAVKATDTKAEATPLVKAAVGTYKLDTLTVKVAAAGTATFSGTYNGVAVSGSTVMYFSEANSFKEWDGTFVLNYVKVVAKKSVTSFVMELLQGKEGYSLNDPNAVMPE